MNSMFDVPNDFASLFAPLNISLLSIVTGITNIGEVLLATSNYGNPLVGESPLAHTGVATINIPLSPLGFFVMDISTVFASIAAGDVCGVNIDHSHIQAIASPIDYFGIVLAYNSQQGGAVI